MARRTCAVAPLLEVLRLKLFMDMRPKALGSTIPPGGGRGVIGGRLLPGVNTLSDSPLEPVPARPRNLSGARARSKCLYAQNPWIPCHTTSSALMLHHLPVPLWTLSRRSQSMRPSGHALHGTC